MEYICHRPYRGVCAAGKKHFFKKGSKLECVNGWLIKGREAICHTNSELAHLYFARNDDGQGFRRGELTHKIAYADRHPNEDNGFRFTPKECEMIETEYGKWVKQEAETLLFNNDFFNAEIGELEELANKLEA